MTYFKFHHHQNFLRNLRVGDVFCVSPDFPADYSRLEVLSVSIAEATITDTDPDLIAKIPTKRALWIPDEIDSKWRITLIGNRVTYERTMQALTTFCKFQESPLAQLIVHGNNEPLQLAEKILRQELDMCKGKEIFEDISHLNESQQRVVELAQYKPFLLVQGPPGTGKTVTAVATLKQWVANLRKEKKLTKCTPGIVMAVAETNAAVDNLMEKLLEEGVLCLRLGPVDRVQPNLREFTISEMSSDILPARKKKKYLSKKDVRQSVSQVEVLCCTISSAGSSFLKPFQFSKVLIDEGSQAVEPVTLIPLANKALNESPNNAQVVIIGDHKQLGPMSFFSASTADSLEDSNHSLFDRLIKNSVCKHQILSTQYRMHPLIAQFPSQYFYDGAISDGVSVEDREVLHLPQFKQPDFPIGPVLFVDISTANETCHNRSYCNREEANMVSKTINCILQHCVLLEEDIGCITPYRAQQTQIINQLKQRNVSCEVSSVDGFQGREKEVILFTSVRTRGLGFVGDERRLNVMLTRARRSLIVFGNPSVLAQSPCWDSWLKWVKLRASFLSREEWIKRLHNVPIKRKNRS